MSDHQKLTETLSALLDSEAGKTDQLELRRLARSLDEHPELVEKYQRYMLARTALKGEPLPMNNFLANVHAALEQEEMEEVVSVSSTAMENNDRKTDWLKTAGRFAIAASVAVIAVTAVQMRSPVQNDIDNVSVKSEQRTVEPVTTHNNRVLNPSVITVSAGDRPSYEHTENSVRGCVLSEVRAGKPDLIWEKNLPKGYVLCKQNSQTKQCEAISEKVGCYLN